MHSLPAASPTSSASLKLRLLASAETLRQRYELLQEYVLARPVRAWADVIEIAEIAHFQADKGTDGDVLALAGACGEDDRVAAALIVAVLEMAKGGANG
jgi:hypothetical protein